MPITNEALFYGAALWVLLGHAQDLRVISCQSHPHLFHFTQAKSSYSVLFKYRNAARPWNFPLSQDETTALEQAAEIGSVQTIYLALICRQDGVCCVPLAEVLDFIGKPIHELNRISLSVNRQRGKQYQVRVSGAKLPHHIPTNAWPPKIQHNQESHCD